MPRRSILNKGLAAALVIALAALALFVSSRETSGPALVVDDALLMREDQSSFVAEFHSFLIDDHDIDYRVVTAADTGHINRFAVEQFAALFARSRSKTGRGLLLVVDPAQDQVRLEVSVALEGVFPDAFVAYVETRQMVPFFRTGRIADGILAATELIVMRAQNAAANAGFETEPWATESAGGSAVAPTLIGAGPEPRTAAPTQQASAPAATPAGTLDTYLAAMAARNGDPDLALYTPDTRRMLRGWTITQAQMDTVVKTYRACSPEPTRISSDGARAVIRYPVGQRGCAPFFFEKIGADWALDLTMMQRAIRFGRTNAWRFDMAVDHPYRFAFADWRFDRHGFPADGR